MKIKKKRLLGIILSIALVLGMMPGMSLKAQAEDSVFYTLDGTVNGGSSNYGNECDISQNNVAWKITGNTQISDTVPYWRIGGGKNQSLDGENRPVYSVNKLQANVSKVELAVGDITATVNSIKLIVASNADFSTVIEEKTITDIQANSTLTFTPGQGKEWSDAYYKFLFNISASIGSNKYIEFKSAKFYGAPSGGSDTSDSVTWDADQTIETTQTISEGVTVSNDITVTVSSGVVLTVNGGINADGKTVTVKGPGTLIINGATGSNGEYNSYFDAGGKAGGYGFAGNIIVDGATVTVTGGTGGKGGYDGTGGGMGGAGGNGVEGNVTVKSGSIEVTGGNGGNGGDGEDEGGSGGNGGVGVNGTVTVTGGSATLTGGIGGEVGRGYDSGEAGQKDKAVSGTITGLAVESDDNSNWAAISGSTSEKQYVRITPAHTHSFTYSASGATITATCSEDGCTLPLVDSKHTATLTIGAPTLTIEGQTGEGISPDAVISDDNSIQGEATVQYQKKTDGSYGTATETAPIVAGDYKASITLGEGKGAVTASVEYTIAKLYPVWVGGIQVTSANKDDVLGDADEGATASYTPATTGNEPTPAILKLNGFNDTNEVKRNHSIYSEEDLTIELVGTNTITCSDIIDDIGIDVEDSTLTITGEGKLDIQNYYTNIYGANKIIIDGGIITSTNGTYGIASNFGDITIEKGTITANDNNYAGILTYYSGNVTINGGNITTNNNEIGISAFSDDNVIINGGNVTVNNNDYGIYASDEVIINDGIVTVNDNKEYGIGAYIVGATINGGEVQVIETAEESNGIYLHDGNVKVGEGIKSLVVAGTAGAFDENAIVKNAISGNGWSNVEGTEGETVIEESEDGQDLSAYKRVKFPEVAKVVTAPTAKTLKYTGQAQALVTAGVAEGGTMQYALGKDATTAPTDGWSESIPSKTDAGTYYVWYKAVGDKHHADSEAKCVTIKILAQISAKITFTVVNGSWDDGTTADKTVTLTGFEGDTLKLAANQIPTVGNKPNDNFKAGSWDVTPAADKAITKDTKFTYTYAAKEADQTPALTPEELAKKNELAINAGFKVTQKGSKIKIQWGKVEGADKYEVYVAYCSNKFTKKATKTTTKESVSVNKLKGKKLNLKKNFKVKVVAIKDGKQLAKTITGHVVGRKNAKYSNAKKIKLITKSISVEKGKTAKIKAKTILVNKKKKQLGNAHAKEFRYASSDTNIATVSKKGVVTGKATGTCTVYVYSRNGLAKTVDVTVK